MQFNSLVFLCFFFPLSYVLYLGSPGFLKLILLAIESILFYTFCQPGNLWFYVGILLFNYSFGILLQVLRDYDRIYRRIVLFVGIFWNVAMLVFFKYINALPVMSGDSETYSVQYAIPMGISYIVFQGISMLVDVAEGRSSMDFNPFHAILYLSFFANVIAGPIQKYHELRNQIFFYDSASSANVSNGLLRMSRGLMKKLVIADVLGASVDKAWTALDLIGITAPTAWFCALCYMFQIYFDFSGYSDMAIGTAEVFGLKFAENFRYPYTAGGMSDFWRRWHISLSSWFREYVYYPLGGSRRGIVWINIMIVFLLTGIWHGKGSVFLIWGLYNGAAVVADRYLQRMFGHSRSGKILLRIGMLMIVYIGWIIFRAPSLDLLGRFVSAMFDFGRKDLRFTYFYYADRKTILTLMAAMLLSTKLVPNLLRIIREKDYYPMIQIAVMVIFMFTAMAEIVSSSYSPFIYFNF